MIEGGEELSKVNLSPIIERAQDGRSVKKKTLPLYLDKRARGRRRSGSKNRGQGGRSRRRATLGRKEMQIARLRRGDFTT